MNTTSSELASRVEIAWHQVSQQLLSQRNDTGHWTGQLSSSALATATAVSALAEYRRHSSRPILQRSELDRMIAKGSRWLLTHQNNDGGWGDTDQSHSNVATSMLAVAALSLAGTSLANSENDTDSPFQESIEKSIDKSVDAANQYIDRLGRVQALRDRYGKDKTFAVPILANCAIAGLVSWKEVSALPFEAVLVPPKFFRFINLPVVSYAIPALVAIGQLKFLKDPPWNPISRSLRKLSLKRGLKTLQTMQPGSGGFLEAIPLTCFVAMSLAHSGRADHQVVHRCITFVADSFRDEDQIGTWPIDTNLATWNTTLAVNALVDDESNKVHLKDDDSTNFLNPQLLDWILSCQYTEVHPFTGAEPGGWGWSDLSGAVPDADDTPGALLAIRKWYDHPNTAPHQRDRIRLAASAGVRWLLDLQNRDKGWPTFCRGWGRLPFDRSGNDLTAHVIRALNSWRDELTEPGIRSEIDKAIANGLNYLSGNALPSGGWLPLWFGNQDHANEENPVYGTVKVLLAWIDVGSDNAKSSDPSVRDAVDWLLKNQNDDCGWGGGPSNGNESEGKQSSISSLQETSLAIEALVRVSDLNDFADDPDLLRAVSHGTEWMLDAIDSGKTAEKWPIGFYFAKLWYYENLYPMVFCTSALRCLRNHFGKITPSVETQHGTGTRRELTPSPLTHSARSQQR